MRRISAIAVAGAIAAMVAAPLKAEKTEATRPNILLIVADDLGYTDIGAFGSEIETPNLDALARRGMRLDQFYTSPACSPTRSMLLSGRDNHQVGLGSMAEVLTNQQRGRPGYEGYLSPRVPTLAERLRAAGYFTVMSGKWHLGKGAGLTPADRGFNRSFALLQGAHNHFGFDQSPAYRTYGASVDYRLDGTIAEWPARGYSSDVFTDHMIEFLNSVPKGQPFFGYLAYTAPHWPLQAPAEVIAKYRGRYDGGPATLRRERIARMKVLGISAASAPWTALQSNWDALSNDERAYEARKMEVYAAMVDRMDQNIGRVVELLTKRGELENTIILFMSDNGADALVLGKPLNPNNVNEPMKVPNDNSLANLGAGDSYFSYGPEWAAASSGPFAGEKGLTTEGGIRAPAIVAGSGIRNGTSNAVLHVLDVMPTMLSLANATRPSAERTAGRDWKPLLKNGARAVRRDDEPLAWELFYRAAIRKDGMKAVYLPNKIPLFGKITEPGSVQWRLYDIGKDPGETRNLAKKRPALLQKLQQLWRHYAVANGVVTLPEDAIGDAP